MDPGIRVLSIVRVLLNAAPGGKDALMKIPGRTEKGFTLVEVLIVVVMISILASLTIPRFTGHADRAKAAELGRNGQKTVLESFGADAMARRMAECFAGLTGS